MALFAPLNTPTPRFQSGPGGQYNSTYTSVSTSCDTGMSVCPFMGKLLQWTDDRPYIFLLYIAICTG